MPLGGAQVIPRPHLWRPGPPAPWSERPPRLDVERIRAVFTGRRGAPSPVEADGARSSAVLAPLFERDGELRVLVTRRSWDMRHHRGEVSFPGGGADPVDRDAVDTALRETTEEVGLPREQVEVLGELDHLTTVSSDRFIVPVVGLLRTPPRDLVAEPGEVDAIREVPLSELADPSRYREERWGPPEIDHPVHFFEIEGDTIWGATAAMIRQLLVLLAA